MRPQVRAFVDVVSSTLPVDEPVYEFGSYQVPGQEELANLRPLFPGKSYVGCDMRPGPGVDKVLDLHNIARPNLTAGTVLCLDTLEHVEYCHRAMEEVYRILKPGGMCVISSVMAFPIHEFPYDYWRFTPSGFESLLKAFESRWVGYIGDARFPHTVLGIGVKGPADFAPFRAVWQ